MNQTMPKLLEEIVVQWGPMILLIGVWIFFMRRFGGRGRTELHMDRVEKQLEKIGVQLERMVSLLERRQESK
jgi:ATP-dependent Zn protease